MVAPALRDREAPLKRKQNELRAQGMQREILGVDWRDAWSLMRTFPWWLYSLGRPSLWENRIV